MDEQTLHLEGCMYQYSRAIYRSIKDLIDPYVDHETQLEYRRAVLSSCERATTRKGKPCQRTPLPERDYCPSHQHLEHSSKVAA
jgi:hypothetical protein